MSIRTALTFPHPAQGVHYKTVIAVGHHPGDFRTGNPQKEQLPDLIILLYLRLKALIQGVCILTGWYRIPPD